MNGDVEAGTVTLNGLTHHCEDKDCHVPGFVHTLTNHMNRAEDLTEDERKTLAANVCSCYSRPDHVAAVLGPAVAQIVSDRSAARVQAARAEERERLVNPADETLTRMADAAWAASESTTRWVTHDMMLAALAVLRTPDAAPEEGL